MWVSTAGVTVSCRAIKESGWANVAGLSLHFDSPVALILTLVINLLLYG